MIDPIPARPHERISTDCEEAEQEIDRLLTLLARTASYLDYMEDRGYSSVRVIRSDVYQTLRAAHREAIPYHDR